MNELETKLVELHKHTMKANEIAYDLLVIADKSPREVDGLAIATIEVDKGIVNLSLEAMGMIAAKVARVN